MLRRYLSRCYLSRYYLSRCSIVVPFCIGAILNLEQLVAQDEKPAAVAEPKVLTLEKQHGLQPLGIVPRLRLQKPFEETLEEPVGQPPYPPLSYR